MRNDSANFAVGRGPDSFGDKVRSPRLCFTRIDLLRWIAPLVQILRLDPTLELVARDASVVPLSIISAKESLGERARDDYPTTFVEDDKAQYDLLKALGRLNPAPTSRRPIR